MVPVAKGMVACNYTHIPRLTLAISLHHLLKVIKHHKYQCQHWLTTKSTQLSLILIITKLRASTSNYNYTKYSDAITLMCSKLNNSLTKNLGVDEQLYPT